MNTWKTKVLLHGETFHSEVEIIINLIDKGNLTNGESGRIVEDIADIIGTADFSKVRWERYNVDQQVLKESSWFDNSLWFEQK